MADQYQKVGDNLRLLFRAISTTTGLADNTLVAGDFTLKISKNLTGNQATTGCTFGVMDATNNPGEYYIDCSGTTSFVAATGVYGIMVTVTADAKRAWTQTVRVTSDGTGAGTWGNASFTATASDGRIVSSAVALEGATVRILTSAGVLWAQDESDSSGLWGPVYFNTNGTYSIQVQKSGYTIGTGSIVVSGSTATGPAADISITLNTSSNTLLASDLQAYARRQMTGNTGSLSDTITMEAVNAALQYLSQVRQWPYLVARGTVDLVAAYTTGTVAITNGATTVTLTSGTWPTWAASGILYVDNSWATIVTRTSGSALVLTTAWGEDTVTAASYTIAQHEYTLPTDCMRILSVHFGQSWPYKQEVSASKLESVRDVWQSGTNYPGMWAVRADKFMVWPWPTDNHRCNILYQKRPATLVSGSDTADWDPNQIHVLQHAINYQVALRGPCVTGTAAECKAALDDAIDQSYAWDRAGTDRGLHDGDGLFYDTLRGDITG